MRERPAYVRQLASELELLSHGACTSWNPAGGHGVPDSRAPSGDAHPPHERMLADWDKGGDRVLAHWSDVLKEHKGVGRVAPRGKTEREIVLEDGEGFGASDVAARFRLTASMVRRWRRDAGVNEETGRGETMAATAKRLRGRGVPVRRIASVVGTHPTQVQRWTKQAPVSSD